MSWYPVSLAIGVGMAILVLWTMLLVRNQVPELAEGQRAIRFHVVAEVLTGVLLIIGGAALWTGASWATPLAASALGSALYSTINSPGYYADRGQTPLVVLFLVLAVMLAGAIAILIAG